MQTQTFPAGESPRVIATDCQGRLVIEAWDERSFAVEPAGMADAASLEDGALVIHAACSDMTVRVPAATAIAVVNHKGDLRVETIDGTVRLRDIDGSAFVGGAGALVIERDDLLRQRKWSFLGSRRDVEVREIGAAEIAEVHGSLRIVTAQRATVGDVGGNASVHGIGEHLKLGSVGGSCEVGDVAGELALGHVGGNCRLESISGSVRAGHVGGSAEIRAAGPILAFGNIGGNLTLTDARLAPSFATEHTGRIAVGGSARIELPEQADMTIDAIVGGRISGEGIATRAGSMLRLEYGDGTAPLSLFVGGNLDIQGRAPRAISGLWGNWREFGREFGHQSRAFGRIGRELGREFGKLGRELGREFGSIGRELGRSMAESFSVVDEEQAPARHASQERPSGQPDAAAIKEQRMAILRRVAEGSISVEEGVALLSELQRR